MEDLWNSLVQKLQENAEIKDAFEANFVELVCARADLVDLLATIQGQTNKFDDQRLREKLEDVLLLISKFRSYLDTKLFNEWGDGYDEAKLRQEFDGKSILLSSLKRNVAQRHTRAALQTDLDKLESILKLIDWIKLLLSFFEACEMEVKRVIRKNPLVQPNKQYDLEIFHDAENCYFPKNICFSGESAVKIRNEVLSYIMKAIVNDSDVASTIVINKDVNLSSWNFVLEYNPKNNYHPTKTFLANLDVKLNHISPGTKKDAVDNKIKSLLSEYGKKYQNFKEDVKQRSILVLLAGDRDFLYEIDSLLKLGVKIVLIYRPNTISPCVVNLVGNDLSLGVWDQIIESANNKKTQTLPPNPPPIQPPSNPQLLLPSIAGKFIGDFYKEYPDYKAKIKKIGLRIFCESSHGALLYLEESESRIGHVNVSVLDALKIFIQSRGGRITVSDVMNNFYSQFKLSSGKVLAQMQSLGKLKAICKAAEGITWEDSPDKNIGFGYILCDGFPPDNIDIIMDIIDFIFFRTNSASINTSTTSSNTSSTSTSTSSTPKVTTYITANTSSTSSTTSSNFNGTSIIVSPSLPLPMIFPIYPNSSQSMSRIVKFSRAKFFHAEKYLKGEIGAKLIDIFGHVEMCPWDTDNSSIEVRYLTHYIDDDDATTIQKKLDECKDYLEYIKNDTSETKIKTNFFWYKTDLQYDIELANLLLDNQVYIYFQFNSGVSGKTSSLQGTSKPIHPVFMFFLIPKLWGSSPQDRDFLKNDIISYIKKTFNQNAKVDLIFEPQLHARVTVQTDKQREVLLRANCTSDGYWFDEQVDVVLVCPSFYYKAKPKNDGVVLSSKICSITSSHKDLVGSCDSCGWFHVVRDRINDLQRDTKNILYSDLVQTAIPDSSALDERKALKLYLCDKAVYKVILAAVRQEIEQVIRSKDPSNKYPFITKSISIRKCPDQIELTGLKKYVIRAENSILNYIKRALVKVFQVPNERRNNDFFKAIDYRCDLIANQSLSNDQDTSDVDIVVSRFPCKVIKDPSTSSSYIGIVGWPQFRGLWKRMSDEVQGLIDSFTIEHIPITTRMYINRANIQRIHSLASIFITGNNENSLGKVVISGKGDFVANAKKYIIQLLAGAKTDNREVSCPQDLGGANAAQYLRLPEQKLRMAELCKRIKASHPNVSVTIAGSAKDDNDDSVLTLQGQSDLISPAVDTTLAGVREILECTRLHRLAFPDHEVHWLIRNGEDIGAGVNAVIRLGRLESTENLTHVVHSSSPTVHIPSYNVGPLQVFVIESDFRNLDSYGCDAIINPSNCKLDHIGGLAKAIAEEAGQELITACNQILNSLPNKVVIVGGAVTTAAFNLSIFTHIIHVVTPSIQFDSPTDIQRENMRQCIRRALNECVRLGLECLAIPGVATGIHRWPEIISATEIVNAINDWVKKEGSKVGCSLKKVVLFDSKVPMITAFTSALELRLGTNVKTSSSASIALGSSVATPLPPTLPCPSPAAPDFWWFWSIRDFEPKPITICDYNDAGKQLKIVPYDFDHVVLLEKQYALDQRGKYDGVREGDDFTIEFHDMMERKRSSKTSLRSMRRVFRLPADDFVASLPLVDVSNRRDNNVVSLNVVKNSSFKPKQSSTKLNQNSDNVNENKDRVAPPLIDLNNVSIFCHVSNFEPAKKTIVDAISRGRRTCELILDGLETTDISFDVAVRDLSKILKELHSDIFPVVATPWMVSIRAMGDITLSDAMRKVNLYEKEKMIQHREIPLPPTWSPMVDIDGNERPNPVLVSIYSDSVEYQEAERVLCSNPDGIFNATILRIERVQNVDLYRSYITKRREIAKNNSGNPNELRLKHGTRATDPEQIWASGNSTGKYGFDFRFSLLKSGENLYGNGSYFAEDFSYSDRYSYELPDNAKQMFIALVCCGQIEQRARPDRSIVAPQTPYSSVRGPVKGLQQGIIIYAHHQSYPEYLVTYRD